jgi:hypothetical protein
MTVIALIPWASVRPLIHGFLGGVVNIESEAAPFRLGSLRQYARGFRGSNRLNLNRRIFFWFEACSSLGCLAPYGGVGSGLFAWTGLPFDSRRQTVIRAAGQMLP